LSFKSLKLKLMVTCYIKRLGTATSLPMIAHWHDTTIVASLVKQ